MKQQLRKYLTVIFLGLISIFYCMPVYAQNLIVSGSVKSISGEPITGTTVVVKGTSIGTVTDADGSYSLANVPSDGILIFSFVGLKTMEIPVNGNTNISVVMEEETIGIEEVVAIGYGTVEKRDLTGSVTTVKGDLLSESGQLQLSNSLQGISPGLMVTRTTGTPGSSGSIRIRGITTIGNSSPLVIIDGIPGSITDVTQNDVESITVLKDAASASIYGSRAASGVILITTKRAKSDEFQFEYNVEMGIEEPTRIPETEGAVQYMKMVNESRWNDLNNQGTEYPVYSQSLIDNYQTLNAENPDLYPDTNWPNLLIKDSPRESHRVNISGGLGRFNSKVSLVFDRIQAPNVGEDEYKRITLRANNDFKINKLISTSFDINFKRSISQFPRYRLSVFSIISEEPNKPAKYLDGRFAYLRGNNPLAQATQGGFNDTYGDLFGGKMSLDITPVEGMKISGIFAPNLGFSKNKLFTKQFSYTSLEDPSKIIAQLLPTSLEENRNDSYDYTWQFLGNYTKSISFHKLDFMIGNEIFYSKSESLSASRTNYNLNDYPYLSLGPMSTMSNNGGASEVAYTSYFGRFMYGFKNKYLFQTNARYDGSSRFNEDYRWGLFPSISLGWVVSEESFLKSLSFLSFLKLRASFGVLGNDRIGLYPYQSTIAFDNSLLYYGNVSQWAQAAAIKKYPIPDITWETTETFDIGVDINFLENKLQFVFDYYEKNTRDMLLGLEIPDYIGLENPDQNTGKMKTNGWDLGVNYNNSWGKFYYSFSGNVSDFKSVMGDLGGTEFLGDQVKYEGSEFNEWYGYRSDGLYQTQDEVNNSAKLNNQVKPGDIKYIDISGPDGVPDGKITSTYDRVLLGGSLPRFLYGGNIRVGYGNFDLSMIFQGVGKQNSRLERIAIQPVYHQVLFVPKIVTGKYWSVYNSAEQNQNALYPRLSDISAGGLSPETSNNYSMSDYWIFNGAYFRCKNIVLSYNIPSKFANKIQAQSARVYVGTSDLFSIDNYPRGWDPEVSPNGYFITRSLIFGASIKF